MPPELSDRHVPLLEAYARSAVVVHVEPEVSMRRDVARRFGETAVEVWERNLTGLSYWAAPYGEYAGSRSKLQ